MMKGLIGTFVGLLLAATPVAADTYDSITVWEVQENVSFTSTSQIFNANLVGLATDRLCPDAASEPCPIDMTGKSLVALSGPEAGTGTSTGTLRVLEDLNPDPSSPYLSDLTVVRTGSYLGTIDITPLLLFQSSGGTQGAPIATLNGIWRVLAPIASGTFTATFHIAIPAAICTRGWAYSEPDVLFECLALTDFSLGVPITRVSATLSCTTDCE